jgi:uncharacterized protein (TIGR03067 family)
MRRFALFLVAASLAFAPAPLPRQKRDGGGDDLARFQGVWVEVSHNGRAIDSSPDVVEVKGDIWRANTPSDSWVITLHPHARPKAIDLVRVGDPKQFFRGIYKLEGDTFTYSIRDQGTEAQRPREFEPHRERAPWVGVFKRRR